MNKHIPQTQPQQARFLTDLPIDVKSIKRVCKNKMEYYNYPVAFDIETSSFTDDNGEPRACMWCWQMCFGDSDFVVYGRTWNEFDTFIKVIRKHFHLKKDRILVIYVHNLPYEFQWIRKRFDWAKIFALDEREPLYSRTKFGIEFRCSYHLSGFALRTLAKNLTRHKIEKLEMDYFKVRHSNTPIKPEELNYNLTDVKIVCAYISERLEIDGDITKIPMTKTGYVRNACKIACFGKDHKAPKYFKYRDKMRTLTIEPHEFYLLKNAFAGGYTHANSFYVRETLGTAQSGYTGEIESQDFTSSYPYVVFGYEFPWSKGVYVEPSIEEVINTIDTYAYILEVELYGVESVILQDDYISASRCMNKLKQGINGVWLNNGRVNRAEYLHLCITSVDLKLILKTYRCTGGIRIICGYRYLLSYLPTDFIKEMLSYYVGKTTLKGVDGKEEEYLYYKGQLNSFYGMMVTNPLRDTITYNNNEWGTDKVNLIKGLNDYNKNINRFMFYPVGVFVTSYARYNVWDGILNMGSDYVYSDTDSIKFMNPEKHKNYFDDYNKKVVERLQKACNYHKIPWEMVAPKTIKGEKKILGVWDFDASYSRFKTLGAKRYMVEYSNDPRNGDHKGEISLTVSGLNKKSAIPYLVEHYGKNGIFDAFKDDELMVDNMIIPKGHSGRMISTYIDEETSGKVVDYLGNIGEYDELSSINLSDSTYTLSLSKDYIRYLIGESIKPDFEELYSE